MGAWRGWEEQSSCCPSQPSHQQQGSTFHPAFQACCTHSLPGQGTLFDTPQRWCVLRGGLYAQGPCTLTTGVWDNRAQRAWHASAAMGPSTYCPLVLQTSPSSAREAFNHLELHVAGPVRHHLALDPRPGPSTPLPAVTPAQDSCEESCAPGKSRVSGLCLETSQGSSLEPPGR